ncbi:uncharacterized protein [Physcomitrium patens]|uniref:Uncharacterized protein n=1 Tax=Physcomitrium patens TaxID=3218 RepID=A9SZE4_PHYPA|nr:hypothetical protein PHYPA_013830 [Physcomitrium patens]
MNGDGDGDGGLTAERRQAWIRGMEAMVAKKAQRGEQNKGSGARLRWCECEWPRFLTDMGRRSGPQHSSAAAAAAMFVGHLTADLTPTGAWTLRCQRRLARDRPYSVGVLPDQMTRFRRWGWGRTRSMPNLPLHVWYQ